MSVSKPPIRKYLHVEKGPFYGKVPEQDQAPNPISATT
jgi:hypothetical protein